MINEIFDNQELLDGLLGKEGGVTPSFPISLGYAVNEYYKISSIPASQIMKDPKQLAKAQIFVRDKFDLPFCIALCDLNVVAEAYGTKLTYEQATIPMFDEEVLKSLDDVSKLEVLDPRRKGRMPTVIGACKMFADKYKGGRNLLYAGGSEGPITAAGNVFGMENFMRAMIRQPDAVHEALGVITDTIIEFLNAQLEQGVLGVGIADPTASCSCISPAFFREFAFPYLKKIIRKVNTIGILLHICGDVDGILNDIARLRGLLIMSVDNVDLKKAKDILARKMIITLGNVSTSTLLRGTPADVEREAIHCIKQAASGGKFLLSSSCDIAVGTPDENIMALIQAGSAHGRYPLRF